MIEAQPALAALIEGNRRFVNDVPTQSISSGEAHGYKLVARQAPFAIIIGCVDFFDGMIET